MTSPTILTAPLILYVNPATGTDSGPGTSATPFKTIQHAFNVIINGYVCAYPATIILADGSYSEQVSINGPVMGTASAITLYAPGNVTWTVAQDYGTALFVQQAHVNVIGPKFRSTAIGSTFINAFNGGVIGIGNVDFGAVATGAQSHILVGNGGSVVQNDSYTISGGYPAGSHILLLDGSFTYVGAQVNIPNPISVAQFILCDHGLVLFDGTTPFVGAGAGHGCTGYQWSLNLTAALFANSSVVPGSYPGIKSAYSEVIP